MKVLIVNTYDIIGGAARAAYRLHRSLLRAGVDSQMLVLYKRSDDDTVVGPQGLFGYLARHLALARILMGRLPGMVGDMFSAVLGRPKKSMHFNSFWLPFSRIVSKINEINPDIVHLHWISDSLMRIEDIGRIRHPIPIVWSLHDNWAFSGGCYYSGECVGYTKKCGACPILESHKENDLSRRVFNRKEKTFSKLENMTIVGLSRWLYNCSLSSTLLKDKPHVNIPNPLDTDIFKPHDKNSSREFWKLPKNKKDKKLILFGALGAIGATSDLRKGFRELSQTLKKLNKNNDIEFAVFGSERPSEAPDFGFPTHYLGKIDSDESLAKLYSAVDVMVVPSLQENLSNAIMESLACATPVVAFDIGGNSDMIDHKQNGYLAQPYDSNDLRDGIKWVLSVENYEELCENARKKVVNNFDSGIVAERYINLYRNILQGK